MSETMSLRAQEITEFHEQLKHYVGWNDEDAGRVRKAWPMIEPFLDTMLDDFYQAISAHEFTRRILTGGEPQITRLKKTLRQWLRSLFNGPYDDEFARTRWQVGIKHVEIGLQQGYAIAALARLRSTINDVLLCKENQCENTPKTVVSINKLLDIDLALIDLAYQQSAARRLADEAAERIKQSERLASIGQMVTGLAHESRNALQRSHACLETLILDIEDRPDALRQANLIQSALDRLHLLYEQVRNYAAPIVLDREEVNVEDFVSTVWQNLEPKWSQYQSQVEFRFRCDSPCVVCFDRYRFDQVLTNLFQNAIEAAGSLGKIRCSVQCEKKDDALMVVVEDNGSGMSEEVAARIFEPFFTTKSKGTGLGLAIARRIIEAHSGEIEIDKSESLGGARFTLTIQRSSQSRNGEQPFASRADGSGRQIQARRAIE